MYLAKARQSFQTLLVTAHIEVHNICRSVGIKTNVYNIHIIRFITDEVLRHHHHHHLRRLELALVNNLTTILLYSETHIGR